MEGREFQMAGVTITGPVIVTPAKEKMNRPVTPDTCIVVVIIMRYIHEH